MPETEQIQTEETTSDTDEKIQAEETTPDTDEKIQAQTAEFGEAAETGIASGDNLNVLLDIQMPITVILGKAKMPFKRLLQLAPGSVLELDKAVGQPADLYVQDVHLAKGDIVVVGDNYGIRIREILGGLSMNGSQTPAKAEQLKSKSKS